MKSLTIPLLLFTVFLGGTTNAAAAPSAQDAEITVLPVVHYFPVTDFGTTSAAAVFTVGNRHATETRTLSELTLAGDNADQFVLTADTCSSQTLAAGGECTVGVAFRPTSRGSKTARLLIPSGDIETPVLSAFVSNDENVSTEAQRRMPPVLAAINVAESVYAGTTYDLTWTLEGYQEDYLANMVIFDCTGTAAGACGNSYDDANKIAESGTLGRESVSAGNWRFGDALTQQFNYRWSFTVPATRAGGAPWSGTGTDIVLRLYVKSAGDNAGQLGSVSLLIPGNLATRYYDTAGRRIVKSIFP